MRVAIVMTLLLTACARDDDGGGGGSGSDLISTPQCLDTIDVAWTYDYTVPGSATLRANAIAIEFEGVVHNPPTEMSQYALGTDPPNGTLPDRTTLELQWAGTLGPMRLYVYFESDGVDWWIREMRHYDGTINTGDDWIYYERELLRCPLGQAYVADVGFAADTVSGSVTFIDLFVRAFL